MARFKLYLSDMNNNEITEVETDRIFVSADLGEDKVKIIFGAEGTGGEILKWVTHIEDSLENALKRHRELYAAYMLERISAITDFLATDIFKEED